MSHDHGRHDSCGLRVLSRQLHSVLDSLAGGMTDVGVGSGALLGLFGSMERRFANSEIAPLTRALGKTPKIGDSRKGVLFFVFGSHSGVMPQLTVILQVS